MAETLRSTIDTFVLDAQTRGLRPQSILTYRRQLGFFARFAEDDLGVTHIDQVTTAVLRGYIVSLQTRRLRPASIRTAGRVLRAWLNFCKAEGLLDDADPMLRVRLPKQPRPDPDCFTLDEVRRIVAATATTRTPERDLAIVLALLDTGCRVNEFTLLTRGDVDLRTGAIVIRGENAKTHAKRTVYIGERARAALADYLATRPPLAADALLWHGAQRPLTTDGMKRLIQRLGQRAGVHPCGAHRIRRTFATWMLRAGVNAKDAAALLGHSIDELLKSYVHSNDEALAAAHAQHGPVDHMLRPKE